MKDSEGGEKEGKYYRLFQDIGFLLIFRKLSFSMQFRKGDEERKMVSILFKWKEGLSRAAAVLNEFTRWEEKSEE